MCLFFPTCKFECESYVHVQCCYYFFLNHFTLLSFIIPLFTYLVTLHSCLFYLDSLSDSTLHFSPLLIQKPYTPFLFSNAYYMLILAHLFIYLKKIQIDSVISVHLSNSGTLYLALITPLPNLYVNIVWCFRVFKTSSNYYYFFHMLCNLLAILFHCLPISSVSF